jgi:hypothetical protein
VEAAAGSGLTVGLVSVNASGTYLFVDQNRHAVPVTQFVDVGPINARALPMVADATRLYWGVIAGPQTGLVRGFLASTFEKAQ